MAAAGRGHEPTAEAGREEEVLATPRQLLASSLQDARPAPERKTGIKHAEVVTARLVQEERGWLKLAG